MSFYRSILALQSEPLDAGEDEARRQTWTMNFDATLVQASASNIPNELAKKLTDASLATLNTDLFLASSRTLPTSDIVIIQILLTGGVPVSRSHAKLKADVTTVSAVRFQVVVRAKNGQTAYDKIILIRDEFDNTLNTTLLPP